LTYWKLGTYLLRMLRPRSLPIGFIEPCLPTSTKRPPSGKGWLHEIKHHGFRVLARKDGKRARGYTADRATT
jgi:ATP-dependent DNA ligase